MRIPALVLALSCAAFIGCVTQAATFGAVPRERRSECERHCAELDLRLAAVVIVRSSAGCVCEVPDAARASTLRSSATAAGAGAIIADEEAAAETPGNATAASAPPSSP